MTCNQHSISSAPRYLCVRVRVHGAWCAVRGCVVDKTVVLILNSGHLLSGNWKFAADQNIIAELDRHNCGGPTGRTFLIPSTGTFYRTLIIHYGTRMLREARKGWRAHNYEGDGRYMDYRKQTKIFTVHFRTLCFLHLHLFFLWWLPLLRNDG